MQLLTIMLVEIRGDEFFTYGVICVSQMVGHGVICVSQMVGHGAICVSQMVWHRVICVPQMSVLQLRGRSCLHIKRRFRSMVNNLFFNVFHIFLFLIIDAANIIFIILFCLISFFYFIY